MKRGLERVTAAAGLVVILAGHVAVPPPAEPNGGRLRLDRAAAGPYLVSAWTRPDPPRVGRLDVSVAVMNPATNEAVLDARASATARPAGDAAPATHARLDRGAGGNLLLYHGNLELQPAGRSRVLVEVSGPAGAGSAAFDLEVEPASRLGGWFVVPIVIVALVGTLWWLRAHGRRKPV